MAANLDVVRELEAERATNSALRRRLAEAESVAAAALERAGRPSQPLSGYTSLEHALSIASGNSY